MELYNDGMQFRVIASRLGLTTGQVASRLSRSGVRRGTAVRGLKPLYHTLAWIERKMAPSEVEAYYRGAKGMTGPCDYDGPTTTDRLQALHDAMDIARWYPEFANMVSARRVRIEACQDARSQEQGARPGGWPRTAISYSASRVTNGTG